MDIYILNKFLNSCLFLKKKKMIVSYCVDTGKQYWVLCFSLRSYLFSSLNNSLTCQVKYIKKKKTLIEVKQF